MKPKPCPFCGKMPRVSSQRAPSYNGIGKKAPVSCDNSRCRVHPQVFLRVYKPGTKQLENDKRRYRPGASRQAWDRYFKVYKEALAWLEGKAEAAAIKAWNKRAKKS